MSASDATVPLPAQSHVHPTAAPAPGATILVVDDSDALRDSLCFLLAHAGYRTRNAGSAEKALDQLRASPTVDLLITDIGLPQADGWSLAREARKLHAGLPVIYISGHAGSEWRTQGVAGGVFLCKPFGFDELLENVTRLMPAVAAG
ncbi:response regulator [Dyella sp. BiH032]|uniref:response regulator n=1 Tax=Dyella sp. BiH032 TaxID=3075430 RepID=UPI002892B66B|nr:response regulator [Dyella sp. BiH032]WNL44351.1 response regulator [Dyella sp. BiH032]